MFTIFNGRQRQTDSNQTRVFAQLDVTLREHIADFKQKNSLNPFAVFIAIALHSNEYGWAWPKTELLKKETGLSSDRAIYAILSFLRGMKLDGKRVLDEYRIYENGKWGNTCYHIFPEAGGAEQLPDKRLQKWGKKTNYYKKAKAKKPPVRVPQVAVPPVGVPHIGVPQDSYKYNHPEGEPSPDNSSSLSTIVSKEEELAGTAPQQTATQIPAVPSKPEEKPLSLEAQTILEALKTQGLITRYSTCFKQEAACELIKAGLVEPFFAPDGHTLFQLRLRQNTSTAPLLTPDKPLPGPEPELRRFLVEGIQHFPDKEDNAWTDSYWATIEEALAQVERQQQRLSDSEFTIRDTLSRETVWPKSPASEPSTDPAISVLQVSLLPMVEEQPASAPSPAVLPEVLTFKPGDLVWWTPTVSHDGKVILVKGAEKAIVLVVGKTMTIALRDPLEDPPGFEKHTHTNPANLRPRKGYLGTHLPETWELRALEHVTALKLAAARAAAPKAGKAPKEHDVLFKRVATDILGYAEENGVKYTARKCTLINQLKGPIMRVMGLQRTPEDYQRGADAIPKYKQFFKTQHPDLDYPEHDSFEKYFKEWWDAEGKPKPVKDTSCPLCHGEKVICKRDDKGIDYFVPCECQKAKQYDSH